jgi:hypothetical protein
MNKPAEPPGNTERAVPGKGLRIVAFANFFKSYMSAATVVAASIPIPVASWKLIPIYAQQRGFLTVYASLFCFLLLAFVFSIRHRLAPPMFSAGKRGLVIAILPFIFILLTLGCILAYHAVLQMSVQQLRELGIQASTSDLLEKVDATEIPYALALSACYLGIFVFAEAAFILMAIREYLEDLLHLNETAMLRGIPGFSTPPSMPLAASAEEPRGIHAAELRAINRLREKAESNADHITSGALIPSQPSERTSSR